MYEVIVDPPSAEEAVKVIKSNDRIYIQAAASASQILINAMSARHEELRGVEVCHLHIEGDAPYADPKYKDSFHVNSLFIGKNVRHTIKAGNGSYTPVFLSEVPNLFKKNVLPVDVALIQVSTPDKHGYCSLGVSVEAILAVITNAKHVIAQINDQMPRVHGEGLIHISELDTFVEESAPIHEFHMPTPSKIESTIGDYIAELIEDRSTLQMGIGSIPNAVLSRLGNHRDLGLHTEMFSDGVQKANRKRLHLRHHILLQCLSQRYSDQAIRLRYINYEVARLVHRYWYLLENMRCKRHHSIFQASSL